MYSQCILHIKVCFMCNHDHNLARWSKQRRRKASPLVILLQLCVAMEESSSLDTLLVSHQIPIIHSLCLCHQSVNKPPYLITAWSIWTCTRLSIYESLRKRSFIIRLTCIPWWTIHITLTFSPFICQSLINVKWIFILLTFCSH